MFLLGNTVYKIHQRQLKHETKNFDGYLEKSCSPIPYFGTHLTSRVKPGIRLV